MALYDQFQWAPGEGLASIGTFTQSQATTREIDARTAKQQAETQDYISQTSKDLREAQKQADISKANANKLLSDVTNDNPVLVRDIALSGMHNQLQKEMLDKGDLYNKGVVQAFGDMKTADDYEQGFKKLVGMNPSWGEGMPTPDEVRQDPSKLDKMKLMAASAWHNNSQFLQKQAEESDKFNDQMKYGKYVQGQENYRANVSATTSRENTKAIQDATNQRAAETNANKLSVEEMRSKSRLDAAIARAKGDPSKIKFKDVLGTDATSWTKLNVFSMSKGFLETNDIDLDKEKVAELTAHAAGYAQQVWQTAMDSGVRPDSPNLLAREYLENQVRDGNLKPGSNFFRSGTYTPTPSTGDVATTPSMKSVKDLPEHIYNEYKNKAPEAQAEFRKKFNLGE